jgi:hypothetical protein
MLYESARSGFSLSIIRRRAHAIDFRLETSVSASVDAAVVTGVLDVYPSLASHACDCAGATRFGQVIAAGRLDLGHVLEHLCIDLLVRAYAAVYGEANVPTFAGNTRALGPSGRDWCIMLSYVKGQASAAYEAMRLAATIMDDALGARGLAAPAEVLQPLIALIEAPK